MTNYYGSFSTNSVNSDTVTPNYISNQLGKRYHTKCMIYSFLVTLYLTLNSVLYTLPVHNSHRLFVIGFLVMLQSGVYIGWITNNLIKYIGTRWTYFIIYSLGNLPELIITFSALHTHQHQLIIETSIGSVLSNTVFLMAGSYFLYRPKLSPMWTDGDFGSLQSKNTNTVTRNPITPNNIAVLLGLPLMAYLVTSPHGYILSVFLLLHYILLTISKPVHMQIDIDEIPFDLLPFLGWIGCLLLCILGMCGSTNMVLQTLPITDGNDSLSRGSMTNLFILPCASNLLEIGVAWRSAWGGDLHGAKIIGIGSAIQLLWIVLPINMIVGWASGDSIIFTLSNRVLFCVVSCLATFIAMLGTEYYRFAGLTLLYTYLGWWICI